MKYRILLEASGSLTSGYIVKAIKELGHIAVGSDIVECAGTFLADEFVKMPMASDPLLWEKIEKILIDNNIQVVIPSLDETLLGWSERKEYFGSMGIHVILSTPEAIAVCQDKWKTFSFFKKYNIPTPDTSLENIYSLVKPRTGRGGKDIYVNRKGIKMDGMISQELLQGEEYTIDVFCDKSSAPIYIIPRKRLQVKDGKSVNGITIFNKTMEEWIKIICENLQFVGPINIQCFLTHEDKIKFTEINPRIAGGMALGFAASENWVRLIVDNLIEGKAIEPVTVQYGMKMFRYYDEVFVS